jgi:hypothetical protein
MYFVHVQIMWLKINMLEKQILNLIQCWNIKIYQLGVQEDNTLGCRLMSFTLLRDNIIL